MALCTLFTRALAEELNNGAAGARIDKINQPSPRELVLFLHSEGGNCRLLLSANPQSYRACFTKENRENPKEPPPFCMLLRKKLVGARILSVEQCQYDRILRIDLASHNEMGDEVGLALMCEFMGRSGNVILVSEEDNRIVDAIVRVSPENSSGRAILPGMIYHLPDPPSKLPLAILKEEDCRELLLHNQDQRLSDLLLSNIAGLSPLMAREMAYEILGDTEGRLGDQGAEYQKKANDVTRRLIELRQQLLTGGGEPWILLNRSDESPRDYSVLPILQYGESTEARRLASFSELLECFYGEKDRKALFESKTAALRHVIQKALERQERKSASQKSELVATRQRESKREMADILGAFAYRIPKGVDSVRLPNLYGAEGTEVDIPLDSRLSIQANIRKYYKEYTKLKNAAVVLEEQLAEGDKKLAWLYSVKDELSRARDNAAIEDITGELREQKLLARDTDNKGKAKKKKKEPAFRPLLYRAPGDFAVLVGRNNSENDRLSLQEAEKQDLWFHVKGRPGSHAVLITEGEIPPEETILFAARLAALHSSGADAGKVEVDYAPAKFVRKPSGALPGFVLYDHQRTLQVLPLTKQEELNAIVKK